MVAASVIPEQSYLLIPTKVGILSEFSALHPSFCTQPGASAFSRRVKCLSDALASGVISRGNNHNSQLALGKDNPEHAVRDAKLTAISGLPAIQAVATGYDHSLALARDGSVWAWGRNGSGQIGDGSTTDRFLPVQVTGLDGILVTEVAVGKSHSLALDQNGAVWAWGYNGEGQLGDGTQLQRLAPVRVKGLDPVQHIAAGVASLHSLALTREGRIWSWGSNAFGQLGLGEADDQPHPTPQTIPGLTQVTSLAGSEKFTLAVRRDGTVWAWGDNDYGQLGTNDAPTDHHVAEKVWSGPYLSVDGYTSTPCRRS